MNSVGESAIETRESIQIGPDVDMIFSGKESLSFAESTKHTLVIPIDYFEPYGMETTSKLISKLLKTGSYSVRSPFAQMGLDVTYEGERITLDKGTFQTQVKVTNFSNQREIVFDETKARFLRFFILPQTPISGLELVSLSVFNSLAVSKLRSSKLNLQIGLPLAVRLARVPLAAKMILSRFDTQVLPIFRSAAFYRYPQLSISHFTRISGRNREALDEALGIQLWVNANRVRNSTPGSILLGETPPYEMPEDVAGILEQKTQHARHLNSILIDPGFGKGAEMEDKTIRTELIAKDNRQLPKEVYLRLFKARR